MFEVGDKINLKNYMVKSLSFHVCRAGVITDKISKHIVSIELDCGHIYEFVDIDDLELVEEKVKYKVGDKFLVELEITGIDRVVNRGIFNTVMDGYPYRVKSNGLLFSTYLSQEELDKSTKIN